jgi:hypothetical protein
MNIIQMQSILKSTPPFLKDIFNTYDKGKSC